MAFHRQWNKWDNNTTAEEEAVTFIAKFPNHHHQRQSIDILMWAAEFWWPSFIITWYNGNLVSTNVSVIVMRLFPQIVCNGYAHAHAHAHCANHAHLSFPSDVFFVSSCLFLCFVVLECVLVRSPCSFKTIVIIRRWAFLGFRHFNHQYLWLNIIITAFIYHVSVCVCLNRWELDPKPNAVCFL